MHALPSPLAADSIRTTSSTVPCAVIVSDVRLYREGLAMALRQCGEIRIAGAVATLSDALALLRASAQPIAILLDTGMCDALALARALVDAVPDTKIVAVAVSDDSAEVVACASAGMAGYVSRDGSIDEVVQTIIGVMQGELRCSPRVAATLFRHMASAGAPRPRQEDAGFPLTPRELEIIALIDRGLSNKQIGHHLHIGTPTVKNHMHHILEKLRVRRRGEAAARVRAGQHRPEQNTPHRRRDDLLRANHVV